MEPVEQLEIVTTQDPYGLRLSGEIDMASAPALHQAIVVAMTAGRPITLDMREVTFIDSSGLKVIVASASEAPPDVPLTLKDPSSVVRRVLELFGMEHVPQIRVVGGEGG